MGPYCVFCDHRCFVPRTLPFKPGTLLMATCGAGMDLDRKLTGFDHTTAVNPSAEVDQPLTDQELLERVSHLTQGDLSEVLRDRDRARDIAAALERELTRARDANDWVLRWVSAMPCECTRRAGCGDPRCWDHVAAEQCNRCRAVALLTRERSQAFYDMVADTISAAVPRG